MINSKNEFSVEGYAKAAIDTARMYLDSVDDIIRSTAIRLPSLDSVFERRETCKIPPPCWLPRSLGEYTSKACPCGTALIRLRVTNCGQSENMMSIKARYESDTSNIAIKLTPESATLGPMERKWFTVSVSLPDDACVGKSHDVLIWLSGCNEHYLRWTVNVEDGHSGSCQELTVEDCPDYIHHWYDHFYCARECQGRTTGDVSDER